MGQVGYVYHDCVLCLQHLIHVLGEDWEANWEQ